MKSVFRVSGCALLCSLMSCLMPRATKVETIENFTLAVPKDAKVLKQYSMEDFDLYECSLAGVRLLNFYVGNAPTFPKLRDSATTPTETALNGLKAKDVQTRTGSRVSRETLVEVPAKDWPDFVHFWYDGLDYEKAEVANRIIASIRMQSP
jgi:hypothetical protein